MPIYGYARISRKSQNIERQIRNIKKAFPDAHIVKEALFTVLEKSDKTLEPLKIVR